MDKEILKRVVVEQRETIERKFREEDIIEREIQKEIDIEKTKQVLAVTGARRSGKSILAHLLLRNKDYAYINFDDERLEDFKARDFDKLLGVFYELYNGIEWFIFDEIHNVPKWELFVTRFHEGHRIIITGSNSRLLTTELSYRLTGRHMDIKLLPFSFREFLRFRNFEYNIYLTEDIARIRRFLDEYIKRGGFPEADQMGVVATIYNDIINKDILLRKNIKFRRSFREFAKLIISNFSSRITYSSLKKHVGVRSENTIRNYLDLIEEVFLVFSIPKFSFKLKEHMKEKKKVYAIDTGLINYISFQTSRNIGRIYENIVALELLRKNKEIYYFETKEGYEVDFVVKEGLKVRELIQVCYDIDENVRKRELRALLHASKKLKCKNLLVITDDHEGLEEIEWFGIKRKIRFIPLWRWLLSL